MNNTYMEIPIVYPTKFNNRCEIETIIVKTNIMCKEFITILMLKQLIVVKSNEIFVLQTAGKGTSCPACVWQTVPPCRHSSSA